MYDEINVFLNGSIVPWRDATVHVFTPSMRYGSGVFEGIAGYWNEYAQDLYIFRLADHLKRLALSEKVLELDPPISPREVEDAIVQTVQANTFRQDITIRVSVYLDGYGDMDSTGPTGIWIVALPRQASSLVDAGCSAHVSSWSRISDSARSCLGSGGNSLAASSERSGIWA